MPFGRTRTRQPRTSGHLDDLPVRRGHSFFLLELWLPVQSPAGRVGAGGGPRACRPIAARPRRGRLEQEKKLYDAGLTAREIADYLGHERISTTQEDYMERGVVGEDVGPALAERPKIELPKEEG